MSVPRDVCPDCESDLNRALHAPDCEAVARERRRAREAMTPGERWLDDLVPRGTPVLLHGHPVYVRAVSVADIGSPGPTITLIVEPVEGGPR